MRARGEALVRRVGDGACLRRRGRLALELPLALGLGLLEAGEVARDLREALAALQRRQDAAAEEARAILAQHPAIALGAALLARAAHLVVEGAALAVFRQIQHGARLAEHLGLGV